MVCSLSRALPGWLGRGELGAGEDEDEEDTEGGKLQQLLLLLLLLLQAPPPPLLPLPPQGSRSWPGEAASSPRSERARLSGTLRPSLSSMSRRSGSGASSMASAER